MDRSGYFSLARTISLSYNLVTTTLPLPEENGFFSNTSMRWSASCRGASVSTNSTRAVSEIGESQTHQLHYAFRLPWNGACTVLSSAPRCRRWAHAPQTVAFHCKASTLPPRQQQQDVLVEDFVVLNTCFVLWQIGKRKVKNATRASPQSTPTRRIYWTNIVREQKEYVAFWYGADTFTELAPSAVSMKTFTGSILVMPRIDKSPWFAFRQILLNFLTVSSGIERFRTLFPNKCFDVSAKQLGIDSSGHVNFMEGSANFAAGSGRPFSLSSATCGAADLEQTVLIKVVIASKEKNHGLKRVTCNTYSLSLFHFVRTAYSLTAKLRKWSESNWR